MRYLQEVLMGIVLVLAVVGLWLWKGPLAVALAALSIAALLMIALTIRSRFD